MISKVTIKNFKSLRDVEIDLERFTVFVGPNASGKSSALQALDLLCRAFQGPLNPKGAVSKQNVDAEMELAACKSRGAKGPVELLCKSRATWYGFRTRTESARFALPAMPQGKAGDGRFISTKPTASEWQPWQPGQGDASPPYAVLLRLEASKLVQPLPSSPDPTNMAPDGTGLHSALLSMAVEKPESWQALQADLRRVIPSIRRLRHTEYKDPTKLQLFVSQQQPPPLYFQLLFDTVGADELHASQVSEGTLVVLGMLAALHGSGRSGLVLLDDLERGLHPKAQRELIGLLRTMLDKNPDLQILATTHSPYLLDCMEANEVRMTVLGDDGATACAPLTRHPEFHKWKDEMTPGEMWSLFGEKWQVEQEAGA